MRGRSGLWPRFDEPDIGSKSFEMENRIVISTGYTAVIRQDGPWWIGWIEEVRGVNSQGETREELISNLREALSEAIEMNRKDARKAAGELFEEITIQP